MRKVLIVSPHFPPINAPDMQRVRMSLPYYAECGWQAVVLAVDPRYTQGLSEPLLSTTVPPSIRVIHCKAIPRRVSRWIGLGTLGLRCWWQVWRAGSRLLAREKFDLVFFSTTQFTVFTLGPIWRRRFKVPYVLDVQDPWRTDYYERPGSRRPPGGWKYQFARFQARLCEGWCFTRASGVMSVSPSYLDDLRARYIAFRSVPTSVLRFGASQEDLDKAAEIPEPSYRFERGNGEIHFLYTGASGPVMPHALTVLFDAFRLYREKEPQSAARFRFHFVGTSYVAPGEGKPSVLPIAEACGVADQVFEVPHRLGYMESTRLQLETDFLLLLGSSDLAYSPSKVYMYYLTRRPILGLVFRDSVMERLLDEMSCAYMVRFREREPKDEAHEALRHMFELAAQGRTLELFPARNERHFDAYYRASALTRRQCALFDQAAGPAA